MVNRKGINKILYNGLCEFPPTWTAKCKTQNLNKWNVNRSYVFSNQNMMKEMRNFLNATTDTVRLFRAAKVSRLLLTQDDLDEIKELRDQVQLSELFRVIPYGHQMDHTAHTLYLYLLGVYIFLYSDKYHMAVSSHLGYPPRSPELIHIFLFRWMFAGLLHDIGYIFQGRKTHELRAVDRIYRRAYLYQGLKSFNVNEHKIEYLLEEYMKIKPKQGYENIDSPESILDALREIPWAMDINFSTVDTFNIFRKKNDPQMVDALEKYVYKVAKCGYDGTSSGIVDHAVASGLLFSQYCSLWYYFAKKSNYEGHFKAYKRYNNYLSDHILPACFAAASHNVIGPIKEFNKIKLNKDPILYLSILCDELQRWDRFPAGEKHILGFEQYEEYCIDSERITLIKNKGKPVLKYYMANEIKKRFLDKLNDRLDKWVDIVNIL